jgi:outer membrane protein TolC
MVNWKVKLAAWGVAGMLLSGCATEPERVFDPRGLGNAERTAASAEQPRWPMRPLPQRLETEYDAAAPRDAAVPAKPTIPPFDAKNNVVRLPLREMVQRAMINNLEIRVAGYDPAIEKSRVVEAEARFDLTLFAQTTFDYRDVDTAGQSFGFGEPVSTESLTKTFNAQAGLRQLLPSGGQAELRWQQTRNSQDPTFFAINPYWESELVLQLTQPLLRDFGNDINRARIVINRFNQQVSVLEFRRQVEETVITLEQRYWELQQALAEEKIAEDLLIETIDTADILFKRRGQDATALQINQAVASIKARSAFLIDIRRRLLDLSDQIKRLMNDPDLPVTSAVMVLPETDPLVEPIRFDFQDAIDTALLTRLEVGQQQLRVESAAVALQVARNNLLPQLNLVAAAGVQGLDDTWFWSATDAFDFDNNFTGSIGLQFEFPIGNRAARAIYARASLQRQQAIDSYAALVQQVALDVKTALRDVETNWELVVQQQQNRLAAFAALDAAEVRRRNNEPLTPNFVDLLLNLQANYAEARRQEAQSVANYNIAIARFERAKGTLLKYNNIVLDEAAVPVNDPSRRTASR